MNLIAEILKAVRSHNLNQSALNSRKETVSSHFSEVDFIRLIASQHQLLNMHFVKHLIYDALDIFEVMISQPNEDRFVNNNFCKKSILRSVYKTMTPYVVQELILNT